MERTKPYPLQSHVDNYLRQRERSIFSINDPLNYLGEASLYQEFVKWFRNSSLPASQNFCVQDAIACNQFAGEDEANGCPPLRHAKQCMRSKDRLTYKIWSDLQKNLSTRKRPADAENVRELYRFLYRAGIYLGMSKSSNAMYRDMVNRVEKLLLDSDNVSDTIFVYRVAMFYRIMPV